MYEWKDIEVEIAEKLMKDTEGKWNTKMQSWMNKFTQDERCVGGMTAIIERVQSKKKYEMFQRMKAYQKQLEEMK